MSWNKNTFPDPYPLTERVRFQIRNSRSIQLISQLASAMHSSNASQKQELTSRFRFNQNYRQKQLSFSNNKQKYIRQGILNRKVGMISSRGSREEILSRASSEVHKLSESNRLKSQIKIKSQQMCFRFKLKLIGLMRRINIKNQQVQKFQKLQPEQFITNFYNKITYYYKDNQEQTKKLRQKYQAIVQTLKYKTDQYNKLTQKNKQIAQQSSKYVKLIKQQNKIIGNKQRQISSLQIQIQSIEKTVAEYQQKQKNSFNKYNELSLKMDEISRQSYLKSVQIQSLNRSLDTKMAEIQLLDQRQNILQIALIQQRQQINKFMYILYKRKKQQPISENSILKSSQTQQHNLFDLSQLSEQPGKKITTSDANRQQFIQKIAVIVQQWKNHLYNTVNQYEKMLQDCNLELSRKQQQIKYLKNVIQNYINNKTKK